MIKLLNVVGARPQIIKSSAVSRAISKNLSDWIDEVIVHTGQHYDDRMSEVFFQEMGIPKPAYNLDVRSGEHGKQTATMIVGLEDLMKKENPDYVVVYGDTNSTLAAAVAASKMNKKIVHIEAGMRSFNKSMPEEINRILCDHVSSLLFTPTKTGLNNLIHEGFQSNTAPPYNMDNPGIFHCGDIMYDNALHFSHMSSGLRNEREKPFILLTVHRPVNTDNKKRLQDIFRSVIHISKAENIDVICPLHPRTLSILKTDMKNEYKNIHSNINVIEPVGYLEMIDLEQHAELVITDSGGVQKEAYYFKKPCVILRKETEWPEIIEQQTGRLVDAYPDQIIDAALYFLHKKGLIFKPLFGDGNAAGFILNKILENENE